MKNQEAVKQEDDEFFANDNPKPLGLKIVYQEKFYHEKQRKVLA